MKLCINSDDFGWGPEINRGILEAVDLGIVSSVSVLVNGRSAGEVSELVKRENISVGLQFAVTSGMLSMVPSIDSKSQLRRNIASGKISDKELQSEVRVQVAKFEKLLKKPMSHIDSHQKVDSIALVRGNIRYFAAKNSIPFVGSRSDNSPYFSIGKVYKNWRLKKFLKAGDPIYFGHSLEGANFTEERIKKQILHLKAQGVERAVWNVRPGYPEKTRFGGIYNEQRLNELLVLKKISGWLKEEVDIVPLNQVSREI